MTIKQNRIIQWRSQYLEINPMTRKLEEPKTYAESESQYDDDEPPLYHGEEYTLTSFGLHKVDDSFHPLREYQIWLADTNFGISKRDLKLVPKVPGVEIFKQISRYKFIVAVGKLFDFSEVRVNIEYVMCNKHKINILMRYAENDELKTTLEDIKKIVDGKDVWAAYILPNGTYDVVLGDDPEFVNKCELFKSAKSVSNGIIIHS